jgi:hypothetical protein
MKRSTTVSHSDLDDTWRSMDAFESRFARTHGANGYWRVGEPIVASKAADERARAEFALEKLGRNDLVLHWPRTNNAPKRLDEKLKEILT